MRRPPPRCEVCLRAVHRDDRCTAHPYADLLDPQDPQDQQILALRHEMSRDNQRALLSLATTFALIVPTGILLTTFRPHGALAYATTILCMSVPIAIIATIRQRWLRGHPPP